MNNDNSRREFLTRSGKIAAAAALLGAAAPSAYADGSSPAACSDPQGTTSLGDKHYYLDNVLLESGFEYENGAVVHTRTELQTLEIRDGKIAALRSNKSHPDATLPRYDAAGMLMLPAMRDMHIHLDKTFYGGPWRSLNRPAGHHDSGYD
nr:putative deaminase [Raoultella sp. NCTC 9187]